MLDFTSDPGEKKSVPNNQDLPKELDIFYKNISEFLPKGKTFADLTNEEKRVVLNKYRFSPYRPGQYQNITGIGPMR